MWDFKFSRRRVWCSEMSSGLYCRVKWLSTDVSEVRTASIIRDNHLVTRHLYKPRSFCRSDYSSLMMEAVRTSETSVDNHFTRQYNPEDSSEHEIQLYTKQQNKRPSTVTLRLHFLTCSYIGLYSDSNTENLQCLQASEFSHLTESWSWLERHKTIGGFEAKSIACLSP
jgi:hypothetical protein